MESYNNQLGILYAIVKLDRQNSIKIGSTKNFIKRMTNYVTPEPYFDNNSHIIWKFILKKSKYNCYELDNLILKTSKYCNEPFVYLNGSGGIEHYKFDNNIDKLEKFLKLIQVEYETVKVDVTKLRKKISELKLDNTHEIDVDIVNFVKEYNIIGKQSVSIQPLNYQMDVINKLKTIYNKYNKFKLIWACGLGKTILSVFIVDIFKHKKILIGVPTIYLQKQFYNEILKIFPNKNNILCIGSYKNYTTDNKKIKYHYKKYKNSNEPIFIVTTYSSCHIFVNNFNFDLKIGDESHHLVGIENEETKNYKLFHNIKANKSIFMTATEKNIDNKDNKIMYSMDDVETFGYYLDIKTVNWAIENKKITDYNVLILSNTEKEIDNIVKELEIKIDDKNLFIVALMVLKAIQEYPKLTHILICCNRNENADIVSNYVKILLDKNIFDIDKDKFYNSSLHSGKKINIDLDDEDSEIYKFRNSDYGIISSVYIFGEGFDLPKLNGVVFAENMISDIRIVQTALRPNRLDSSNKDKIAHIIIPYMECDDFTKDDDYFNRVRMIISKLRNVDELIEQKIKIQKIINNNKQNISNGITKYNYQFQDNNNELNKIKLRLIYSRALGSKNSEEQDEYNYVKEINKQLNINSKEMYARSDIRLIHKHYIDKPDDYFKLKGIWYNWYDFLGYDTSQFIQSKNDWIKFCHDKKITTLEDYEKISDIEQCLPKNPAEFYKLFSNIQQELSLYKKRICN